MTSPSNPGADHPIRPYMTPGGLLMQATRAGECYVCHGPIAVSAEIKYRKAELVRGRWRKAEARHVVCPAVQS